MSSSNCVGDMDWELFSPCVDLCDFSGVFPFVLFCVFIGVTLGKERRPVLGICVVVSDPSLSYCSVSELLSDLLELCFPSLLRVSTLPL